MVPCLMVSDGSDGDLGFSIGTSLGGVALINSRVNTGSTLMGLGASVDLGGSQVICN